MYISMKNIMLLIVPIFMNVSLLASTKYEEFFSRIENYWMTDSISVKNFNDAFEDGEENEIIKVKDYLDIHQFDKLMIIFRRNIILDSEDKASKIFYNDSLNWYECAFEFIDYDNYSNRAIYRRFIYPIFQKTTSDVYKKPGFFPEAIGVLRLDQNNLSGPYSIYVPVKLRDNCTDNIAEKMSIVLDNDRLKYFRGDKLSFRSFGHIYDYSESAEYIIDPSKITKVGSAGKIDERLFYTMCRKYNSEASDFDLKVAYGEILAGKENQYLAIYQALNDVKSFIASLTGNWIWRDKTIQSVSQDGIFLYVNFEYSDRFEFIDYVLENRVKEYFPYAKDEYYRYPKKMREAISLDMTRRADESDKLVSIKPMMFVFFNALESRLYLYRVNELLEYLGDDIYISTYSSIYYIDIIPGEKIPDTIKWKADYSRYNERNIIKPSQTLIWKFSNDRAELFESIIDGTSYKKTFTIRNRSEN